MCQLSQTAKVLTDTNTYVYYTGYVETDYITTDY
jgi:hypothetical protein